MQSLISPLYLRLARGIVRRRLSVKFGTYSTPRHTFLIMKRWNTDKCAADEGDSEAVIKSNYFPTVPESNAGKRKTSKNVEKKTIPSTIMSIDSTDIPVGPVRKKRNRSKRLSNSVYTTESAFIQQFGVPLSDIRELTCGFNRFGHGFYDVPCVDLARNLLGQILVRQLEDGTLLKGRIVETECYLGGEDKASHSHNGKITDRNLPMYMKPGTAYVYFTYGMYHCFNISSQGPGAAVLLRAVDPLDGAHFMLTQRKDSKKKSPEKEKKFTTKQAKPLKPHELCNGPAKLCISFAIDKLSCNKQDLTAWDGMWVEKSVDDFEVREHHIVKTHRVGIDAAGIEWATKPLRFYLIDNKSISRRDMIKEKELQEIGKLLS